MKTSFSYSLITLWFLVTLLTTFSMVTMADEPEGDDSHSEGSTIFQTKSGPVVGTVSQAENGKEVNVFYGIPYAEPPVGELRFKPPKGIKPWTSVLKADKPLPACYQLLPSGSLSNQLRAMLTRPWSEDCLHLNIWSPKAKSQKLPVIFFIHGGAFLLGSGVWLADGTPLASEDTVVVTFNYRLSAFGFFNLGTAETPGNVGLMDQNLALQWVKENIDVFGGDPESITIMGMSAGGASVGYHLLAPKSRGLFQKAIMMSGSPTNQWAIVEPEKSVEATKNMMSSLGCQLPDPSASLHCIQNRHPEDILDAIKGDDVLGNKFVPTVDGGFITEHPSVSVESGRFNPADVIIGTALDEGGDFVVTMNEDSFKTIDGRLFRRDFTKLIKRSRPGMSDLQCKTLDITYTNWENPDDPLMLRNAAKDIYSDGIFNCDINDFAEKLSQTEATVYRYVNAYKMAASAMFSRSWTGATHGQDQMLALGPPQLFKQFPNIVNDITASKRFQEHILNFAKKGNPNIKESGYPEEPEWPKYDGQRNYLQFAEKSSVLSNFRQKQCATWLNLIPMLQEKKC